MSDLPQELAQLKLHTEAHLCDLQATSEKNMPTPSSTLSSPNSPSQGIGSQQLPASKIATQVRPSNAPLFLTSALARIFARTIDHSPRVPVGFYRAAEVFSRGLPGSNEPKWRVEVRAETNEYPKIGRRASLNFIIWRSGGEEPKWAGEIMVDLLDPGEKQMSGKLESVAWRYGPKLAPGEPGVELEEEWRDWRMFHLQRYVAIKLEKEGQKVGSGTEKLAEIQVEKGKSMVLESVVGLVFRAVGKALGKPYEPEKQQLAKIMGSVAKHLTGQGKDVGRLVVTRGFRESETKGTYLPAAFVEVHLCQQPQQVGPGGSAAKSALLEKAAAVILIDVWASGRMKIMGAMFAGEEPVIHFYRSRYPPPATVNIERADERGSIVRTGTIVHRVSAGEGAEPLNEVKTPASEGSKAESL